MLATHIPLPDVRPSGATAPMTQPEYPTIDAPSPLQTRVLYSLSEAAARLEEANRGLIHARAMKQAEVELFCALAPKEQQKIPTTIEAYNLLPDAEKKALPLPVQPRSWEKTEAMQIFEAQRREAKKMMQHCIAYLAVRRMYSINQIQRIVEEDGHPGLFDAAQVAIDRADVLSTLHALPNQHAQRAFVLRYKFGLDDQAIATELRTSADAINRLCNIALAHAHLVLNLPVVASVRSQYMNFCIRHGLEFPEYADLRGR